LFTEMAMRLTHPTPARNDREPDRG
jgi:hypothetical protein